MADKEFTREQKRVEEVIRVIESHLKKLEEKAGDLRKDVISLRKTSGMMSPSTWTIPMTSLKHTPV